MPKAKQISAWIDDRPGMLGKVADALAEKKVDIRAFMVAALDGKGFLRLVVNKTSLARRVLSDHGWDSTVDELAEVVVPDRPGALGRVADSLGAAGINIHHGFVGSAHGTGKGKVSLFLAVDDVGAALRALRK